MAKQSFADIYEQWERLEARKKAERKSAPKEEKVPQESPRSSVKIDGSFGDIYSKWEQTHDESSALDKRAKGQKKDSKSDISINAIRRMNAQDELDLHEMKLEDAIKATNEFLDQSVRRGLRKVRIITGKGLHSKGGEAVLRPAVTAVCQNHPKVREVSVPKAAEGGSGALTVIFKMH